MRSYYCTHQALKSGVVTRTLEVISGEYINVYPKRDFSDQNIQKDFVFDSYTPAKTDAIRQIKVEIKRLEAELKRVKNLLEDVEAV